MNLSTLPPSKKVILLFLCLVCIANFLLLVYALVYASPDSMYRKSTLAIGLAFIAVTRLFKYAYNAFLSKY
jgi:hypothetical protein